MKDQVFDSDWVLAAKAGDQEAIANLYQYSYQNVYLTIRSMLNAEEDIVLDLLQDSFLKAFQHLDSLDNPEKFNAWVKSIARNTVLDHTRKTKAILFSELSGSDEEEIDIELEDDNVEHLPEVVIDRQETARLLKEILDSLPEGQRMVVSLFYYQDMSIKEIAHLLGNKDGTIKAQLSFARNSIKKKVLELEKKDGVKLYSLAPLPFFLLLIRSLNAVKIEADMAALGGILGSSGVVAGTAVMGSATAATAGTTEAATAGTTATVTSAVATVGTVLKGVVVKIIAGVLAVTVAIGGGVAIHNTIGDTTEQASYNYESLLSDYYAIICGELSMDNAEIDLIGSGLRLSPVALPRVDDKGYFIYDGSSTFYYAIYDINSDGADELIIREDTPYSSRLLDIFTLDDGQPTWLIASYYRDEVCICEDGIIRNIGSGGARLNTRRFFAIENGKLRLVETAEENWGKYTVNGVSCSEQEFQDVVEKYIPVSLDSFNWIKIIP